MSDIEARCSCRRDGREVLGRVEEVREESSKACEQERG
jgi:hypothetical protein